MLKKIKIGANKEYPLEASIIIPKQQVIALVVFVHGSGALDKNERVGNVTPFFDLAIGLVKYNIASIRFDKRTYSHPLSLNKPDYTPYDEIIDDAISAAKTLLKQFSGQTIPLFLLGHSQGGTFLTQISKQIDMPVSGLILLAPPSSSALYPDALRQLQQFIAQHPDQKQDLQILIEQLETQILHWENYKKTQVKQGDFPLHLPASYLTFIESYSPVKEIKKVNHPTLLLQGEKDTQVLADTDFINWKLALQTSKKAKFFLYKDLTHLFTKNNAEDGMPHMEKQVIQDINHWILTTVQKIDLNNQSCLFDDSATKP
ncbi:alpha/beta hydrolase [Acinetobacter stercoris]|uniref:Alpha/beta hydrolase family protein n=1 Tax=Acinetobacter stercoris TaxID=2126983 RepID=A0A2U3MWC7_9GAMM|nr:alpha/beta fold hydrolase [Acinetobacter stercoris]SPL69609.1 Alpha/beta hydrolase family protein [Acinetobacter stercoris]